MKIICIGRNYAKHAKELGNTVPTEPVYFMKPDSALLPKKQPFFYPNFTKDLHYEVELVIKICKLGKNISKKFANTYYNEIGLGIDFTARDIQLECKAKGLPWEKSKAFDYSAPLSREFIQKSEIKNLDDIAFSLEKNGKIVQKGNSKDMLFDFDQLVCYISQFMTLKIGDLIFTGTPAGVGPVKIGDQLTGYIEDKKMLDLNIK
ncbi:MAG: fumarylacetoacetate hydrolase family protein [Flavobacteriales bacterium]|nr:fumarylacetoacetate hydrolase family protein [Flavobacteriales bacterium]